MPRVQVVQRAASAPRFGARGVWARTTTLLDNPVRYKLNRGYGDEFEHQTFASLQKRWTLRSTTAADFDFSLAAGSALMWNASTSASWLYGAAPAGDFQAILEFNPLNALAGAGMAPTLALLTSAGAGAGASFYNDSTTRGWTLSAWAYSNTATGDLGQGGSSAIATGKRLVVALRRSGTNLLAKFSSDSGVTWSTEASVGTVSSSNNLLGIGRPWSGSTPGWIVLHRLNVYSSQVV